MRKKLIALVLAVIIVATALCLVFPASVKAVAGEINKFALLIVQTCRVTSTFDLVPGAETLTNTFTLSANPAYIWASSTAAVTSDTTTAIVDGQYQGQLLLIKNDGSFNVIVKNSANTDLGTADVTLGATDEMLVVWDGADWNKLFVADN